MKKLFALALSALLAASFLAGCATEPSDSTESKPKIGVIQYMDHPSLDTIRDSFKAKLTELGYIDGENCEVEYQSAAGDGTIQNTILQSFKGDQKDVIVAIATPSAQAAASVASDIPLVFSAVSDPVGAGLVASLETPGGLITGTSDEIQVELILELALKYNPDLKTLGVIYNTGEANSETNIGKAKAFCEEHNIEVVEAPVTSTNEVQQAAQTLCSKADAIFAPNDNTVASAMAVLADAAIQAKVPVYTGADSMVVGEGGGGFATIGINYEDLGAETAVMVDEILKGAKAGDIPVKVFKENLQTIYNEETAAAIGIEIQK